MIEIREKPGDMQMAAEIARLVDSAGGRTFFVGGFVRDRVLGRENKDIDIEVHGITVEKLEEILAELGEQTEMGASFGIFGLRGYDIDIAMPRKEEATGRGHRDFKVDIDPFIGTYKAAIRRDFTINAMMQDVLTGEIVDHFGGLDDIRASVLRHVNDDTFAEDPLRVLRAAQFAARFNFSVAEETVSLAKTMDLTALSWERIAGELQKALLKADAPSIFFREMRRMDQLSYWFPEMEQLIGLEQNPEYHPEGDVWTHTLMVIDEAAKLRKEADYPMGLMITAMVHDMGKAVCTTVDESGKIRSIGHENESELIESALSRITTEIRLKKYVHNMTQLHMRPVSLAKQTEKQKPYDKLFDQSVDPHDLLLFAKADYLGRKDVPDYTETEQLLQEKLRKFDELMSKPYVMGRDLVEMGLTPGPEFKELLEYAHTLRLAGVDKKAALSQTMALHRSMQND